MLMGGVMNFNGTATELWWNFKGPNDYPPSDMRYVINITTDKPGSIKWSDWHTQQPTCPGHPVITVNTSDTPSTQTIIWDINRTAAAAAADAADAGASAAPPSG